MNNKNLISAKRYVEAIFNIDLKEGNSDEVLFNNLKQLYDSKQADEKLGQYLHVYLMETSITYHDEYSKKLLREQKEKEKELEIAQAKENATNMLYRGQPVSTTSNTNNKKVNTKDNIKKKLLYRGQVVSDD